jgi:superfamily II DNA or RNA helicase
MKFFEKQPGQLQKQVRSVEEAFGDKLAPHRWEKLSRTDVESDYKVRYEIYLDILRKLKNGENANESISIDATAEALVKALNNLETYIEEHRTGQKEELRSERQISVFDDLHAFLEGGGTEGYIKLPTGVGKTVIFLKLIESLGLKALIVVPSKVLINQTGEKIEEFTDLEFGTVFSDAKDYSKAVTITTYASLVSKIKEGKIKPEEFPVLILDEAHRSLSGERASVIEKFHGLKFGFTATPQYSRTKSLEHLLINEIHSMELHEAIQEGLLCETHTIHAFTDIDMSGVKVNSMGELDQADLERVINVVARNQAAVELYKRVFSEDKVVCYCTSIAQAENLKILFEKEEIPCALVTGETKKDERKTIFEDFESGKFPILLNVKVLVEGFDEPSCNVAFNLHPTLSLVDAEQRGGRPLRLHKPNPDKVAYVVDFIDKNQPKPAVLFSEILGGSAQIPETSKVSESAQRKIKDKIDLLSGLDIEGLRVVTDAQSILEVSSKHGDLRIKETVAEQKEGWESVRSFSVRFNLPLAHSRGLLSSFGEGMPAQIERQREKDNGRIVTFYGPKIIERYIKEQQDAVEKERRNQRRHELANKRQELLKGKLTLEEIKKGFITHGFLLGIYSSVIDLAVEGWVRDFEQNNPDEVTKIDAYGEEVKVYTPATVAYVKKRFDGEVLKYPVNSLPQLMNFISAVSHSATLSRVEQSIVVLKKEDPSGFGSVQVFGVSIPTFDMDRTMTTLAKLDTNVRKIVTEYYEERKKSLEQRGYKEEKTYMDILIELYETAANREALKEKFQEMKEKYSKDYVERSFGKEKNTTYISPVAVQEIDAFHKELLENEANQLERGSFWERHGQQVTSPWGVAKTPPKKKY